MEFLEMREGDTVFKMGDTGDLFYVILKGKVNVCIPTMTEVTMTRPDFLSYLSKNKEIVVWDKMAEADKLREEVKEHEEELEQLQKYGK